MPSGWRVLCQVRGSAACSGLFVKKNSEMFLGEPYGLAEHQRILLLV